jgi:Holin of 3TMs, for gene-transfer release
MTKESDMALISDPISAVAGAVQSIVERIVPDPAQQMQAKVQIAQMYLNGELQTLTSQAGVITAEASSSNRLASSWRPMLMYCFMAIIANNYILAPYLQAMFHFSIQLAIPPDMWDLLRLGVGGYVVGRSIEKTTSALTGRPATTAIAGAISNIFKGS